MPMLHGVGDIRSLDNMLNNNGSSKVAVIASFPLRVTMEGFVPARSAQVVELLIKDVSS